MQEPLNFQDEQFDEEREKASKAYLLLKELAENPELLEHEIGKKPKKTRGYIDGCYDLSHAGHFNALRQGSLLADSVLLGVCSDADILKTKGPTVLNIDERMK